MTENKKTVILIVEDEEVIRKVYADELRDGGFSVLTAGNGMDGLALALREKPNLILLDILMPIMDGLTMMNTLRETDLYGKNVPVILLTNLSASEEKIMNAITKNEPAYYLVKADWDLSKVVEKIKECLAGKV
ncbi:MAG: response regulator [bacterium]|nr:response regulator [bacterium]MDZ4285950.1 response regulator [Candidatus Sungbacteria bacterium]